MERRKYGPVLTGKMELNLSEWMNAFKASSEYWADLLGALTINLMNDGNMGGRRWIRWGNNGGTILPEERGGRKEGEGRRILLLGAAQLEILNNELRIHYKIMKRQFLFCSKIYRCSVDLLWFIELIPPVVQCVGTEFFSLAVLIRKSWIRKNWIKKKRSTRKYAIH